MIEDQKDAVSETEEASGDATAVPQLTEAPAWLTPLLALAIALLALVAYAPSLLIPFHGNELLLFGTDKPLEQVVNAPLATEILPNAPLALFSLALNRLFSPNSSLGLHLGNILLHMLNGVLLFFLIRKWLGSSSQAWFAAMAAALFVVLPIHTEVVASLTGRGLLQATFFSLSALLFLLHARGLGGSLLALCAYILAVGSHFTAAALPVAAAALLLFKPHGVHFTLKGRHTLPGFAVGFTLLLVRAASGIPQRMELIEGFVPRLQGQSLYFHQFCISMFSPGSQILLIDNLHWGIIGAILLLALFAICAWLTWLKHPLAAPLLWFLGMATIVPCIVPQLDIALPRYTYVCLTGIMLMAAWAFTQLRDPGKLKTAGLISLVVVLSCGTISAMQTWAWQDPLNHWATVAEVNPNHPYPHLQAARYVFYEASQQEDESARIQRYGDAHQRLRRALAADPYNAEILSMLGQSLYYRESLEEAIPTLKDALKQKPFNQTTALFLAQALEKKAAQSPALETFLAAKQYYAHADSITPLLESHPEAAMQYAVLTISLKNYYEGYFRLKALGADAEDHPMYSLFKRCEETARKAQGLENLATRQLQEDPANLEALLNFAEASILRMKFMEALFYLQKVMQEAPQNERAWLLTGVLKAQMNDPNGFLYQYGPLAPPSKSIWLQLATQCAEQGFLKAGLMYLQYEQFDKSHAQPYVNMAAILMQLQQEGRAIIMLNDGRKAFPNDYRPLIALTKIAIANEDWQQAQNYLMEATQMNAPEEQLSPLEEALGIKSGVPTQPVRTIIR